MTLHYHISEVAPYINWSYFFHAWGFEPRFAAIADIHGCDACRAMWLASFPEADRAKAAEAMQLHKEAQRLLVSLEADGYRTHALFRLLSCNADGDDILLFSPSFTSSPYRLVFLRQQQPSSPDAPCLCLADFVRPLPHHGAQTILPSLTGDGLDQLGLFAACADAAIEQLFPDDPYRHLLCQTLADRLAEATAELLHLHVRRTLWGYAPDEDLTVADLHAERFQGIRPAVGHPSLPDQSLNFDLDALLHFADIGISLTETGAMRPHASVSGLMLSHPEARYFSVGHIGEDQLADYARRRGRTVDELRPFLDKATM